jgi:hypothetical protein
MMIAEGVKEYCISYQNILLVQLNVSLLETVRVGPYNIVP